MPASASPCAPVAIAILLCAFAAPAAAFTVEFSTSLTSPQLVGTPVTLDTVIPDAVPGQEFIYKYEAAPLARRFELLRDFRSVPVFDWSTIDDGVYLLRVTVVETGSGEVQQAVTVFSRRPLASGFLPVVADTAHEQVKLLGMRCPPGTAAMRVSFFPTSAAGPAQRTHFKPCSAGRRVHHYIAGLRGETTYTLVPEFAVGAAIFPGPSAEVAVGPSAIEDVYEIALPAAPGADSERPFLMNQALSRRPDETWFVVTDLDGVPLWSYGAGITDLVDTTLIRRVPGGNFLTFNEALDAPPGLVNALMREVDLAGNTVRETNVEAINRHLRAAGLDEITSFHHDALRLDNGQTVVLCSVERILTDVQGPGDVAVYGEAVLALDRDWDPVWMWNAFEKLDPSDVAILGEVCNSDTPGCPPIFLAEEANDWLHMNSIGYSPADGHLILSARHQDAVYKIDYADGTGSGDLVWELGEHGDFTLQADASIEWPWFTHQHDAKYYDDVVVLYDNGNTREEVDPGNENSRGQAYRLDEVNRVAELILNVDLQHYSPALGSAERLGNGNYVFQSGFLGDFMDPGFATVEVTPAGAPQWIQTGPAHAYRSFRLRNLYE